ncbi:hypothetical protein GCM10007916_12990 [Psychromonas marina]|uniref:Uncharacterized protein n=1 Tax=Psychromonas marina TaxID=88364 RepID=A0ABQ6DYK2_9GAMM|nr:hypothetical protein [Psychromonas marina]GLS90232.1 hypothetical protein GCM10007916_12990 [Psychromonas marina]
MIKLNKNIFNRIHPYIATVLLFVSFTVNAEREKERDERPLFGKEIFTKYGIKDDLPKLALSSLGQGEHLVEYAQNNVQVGDSVTNSNYFLVKKTDKKGNIDLRIKYFAEDLDKKSKLSEELKKATRLEYLLRDYSQSYDPSTVKVVKSEQDLVQITFKYSKYGLPQDIAYFRFLEVMIEIKAGQLQRMVITNSQPFDLGKYIIDNYHQEIIFTRLDNERLYFQSKKMTATGKTRNNKPVTLTSSTEPVALYGDNESIEVLDAEKLAKVSDPRVIEEKVEIHRVLPLMGDLVRRKGIDLPLPYGISASYRTQDMNIPFTGLNVMGLDLNDIFSPEDSLGRVSAESLVIRGDVNILPFWNVFVMAGKINIDAVVDGAYTGELGLAVKDKLNNKLSGLGDYFCDEAAALCNSGTVNVPLNLEYDVIGAGTTLSVGYKEFFASLTGSYTTTRLKGTQDWGDGIITAMPMIGYQLVDYRTQFFVGAEYQALKPYFRGTLEQIEIGGEMFSYDIDVNLNKWAYMIGFNKQIGNNYNITFMYNKGETRSSSTLNLGYRF